MPLYTKTGDTGKTFLADGSRIPKTDERIELIGLLDELNAAIGFFLVEFKKDSNFKSNQTPILESIQSLLFTAGAEIAKAKLRQAERSPASPPRADGAGTKINKDSTEFFDQMTQKLEKNIDELDKALPPLQNFILPGGSESAARAHLCRTLTRTVERALFRVPAKPGLNPALGRFLNRLSDYFFVLARHCNHTAHIPDVIWKP